jgi:hypothetical protein
MSPVAENVCSPVPLTLAATRSTSPVPTIPWMPVPLTLAATRSTSPTPEGVETRSRVTKAAPTSATLLVPLATAAALDVPESTNR